MKKLIILLTLILTIFAFTGCAPVNEYGHEVFRVTDKVTFVKVADTDYFDIFVHKETKVMYAKYDFDDGFSIMLDRDGKPLTWKGDI